MKKLLIAVLCLCVAGVLYAATNVPIPGGISVLTKTQVADSTPTYKGQVVICSNCANINNGTGYVLCTSTITATARNGFILSTSSLTAVTACQ